MGLRDTLKAKAEAHGGLRGLAKEALRRATGASPSETPKPSPAPAPKEAAPAPSSTQTWVDVGPSSAVREAHPGTFQVGQDMVAVFRAEGRLYAIDQTCVHEDGPLGEGRVEGHVVICPYHDWRYDLKDGKCLTEPGRAVACFEVREQGGRVQVGRKVSDGSADRGGEHDDGLKVIGP